MTTINKNVIGNGRYRSLVVSISLFLTLIAALLVFTFMTSSVIERNTVLINETNQVTNATQSVIKDLFDLDNSYGENLRSPHIQRVLTRLEDNSALITQSLSDIENGATIVGANGKSYKLPKAESQNIINDITLAKEQWSLLSPKVNTYLESADDIFIDSSDDLSLAVDQAKTSSLFINEALDDLTKDVFAESQREADIIRFIQILGVIAVLAYFIIFVFFFVRRLRHSDAETIEARRETKEILETVNTGLFLLDKDLNIGQQYSKALKGIIGTDRVAGENFTNILRGRISDKDLTTTRQFIEQLYNPRVKEKLVNDLNPLRKVMLHNSEASQNGGSSSSYLDFKFSRVYEGKEIARILVNVSDVSEAVKLEKRLEQEREQNDMQIEMLATILNVQPKIINEFIGNTKVHIEKMNNILKNPGSSQFELESKLKLIYREMHSLKGEASTLKLHSFTKIASDAEDKLHALQNQSKLSGNDFLALTVNLDELLSLSNTIEALGERINQVAPASSSGNEKQGAVDNSTDSVYQEFVADMAQRQGKQVNLNTKGFTESLIPKNLLTAVKEINIQLLRNAVVHGIESPSDRLISNKAEMGQIELSVEAHENNLFISLKDDGQGINYDAIRQILLAGGMHTPESVAKLTQEDLLKILFSSGFSTRSESDEDGGRGVGLDIIKDRVNALDGEIEINSDAGKMTQFVIKLPLVA